MSPIEIHSLGLAVREVVNIFISVFTLVMTVMLVRFVVNEIREHGYRKLDGGARAAIALALITTGEFVRSATIWEILHFSKLSGSYVTQVMPLLFALGAITLGSLYAIRILSDHWLGHWLWIGSLATATALATIAMVWR